MHMTVHEFINLQEIPQAMEFKRQK